MKRTSLFFASLCILSFSAWAQDQRHLEFKIEGCAGDTIYLANYYGNKLFYSDTAVANAKGVAVFERAKGYKAGVYAVVVPGPKYFEILVDEPLVVIDTKKEELSTNVVVKTSEENKGFYAYIRYINDMKTKGDELRSRLESTTDPIAKGGLKQQLKDMDKEMVAYQRDVVARYPKSLLGLIVGMSLPNDAPEIKKPDGSVDSSASYYTYRAQFWNGTDLTDERITRTPVFQNKLDEYIGKVVPQFPDTIIKLTDDLIGRLGTSPELYKFVVHNITYKYETSEIMGMDAVFVHMVLTYYKAQNGQPSKATWMPDDKLKKMVDRAEAMAPLVIGAKARNIILTDTTEQKWIGFYTLPQDYVLLVFWEPHCGHCKKALPDLYKQYVEKLRPIGIEVFAIAKATDSSLFADWKSFIVEHKLDWVNVGLTTSVFAQAQKDASPFIPKYTTLESLNYGKTWDVVSTPKFYLVDADRKIVGKQITPDQIVDLVTKLRALKAKKDAEPKP